MNNKIKQNKLEGQIIFHISITDMDLIRKAAQNERLGVGPYIRSHLIKEIEANNLNKAMEESKLTG